MHCGSRSAIIGTRFRGAADADLDRWAEGVARTRLGQCRSGMSARLLADQRRPEAVLDAQKPRRFRPRRRRRLPRTPALRPRSRVCSVARAQRRLSAAADIAIWSRALVRLAREAPESVVAVASRTEMILQDCDSSGFETFIATGLKVHARRSGAPAGILHAGGPPCRAGAGTGGRRADAFPATSGYSRPTPRRCGGDRRCCAARLRRRADSLRAASISPAA